MATIVTIELARRADKKLYLARPLTRQQLSQVRQLTHTLVCRQGLSVRAAQRRLLEAGQRRALGTIMRDLTMFECPSCLGQRRGQRR
jgi:hypothetical protein